jgi:broad specificity phosphatase PhoE
MAGCRAIAFGQSRTAAERGTTTTVILVRHGDRATEPGNDPPLTAAGVARAGDLALMLRDAGIQAIITTQFRRTKETAAPLARQVKIVPEEVPDLGHSADEVAAHARAVARSILERHRGQTVLVVGHGHTVPAIIAALGAPRPPPICESVFDRLFVVTVPASGPATTVELHYGAASPTEASCGSTSR